VLRKIAEVREALDELKQTTHFVLGSLIASHKQFLVERHLMFHRACASRRNHKSIDHGSTDEVLAIMVNEEDHIRMQVMQSGFNLHECWHLDQPSRR